MKRKLMSIAFIGFVILFNNCTNASEEDLIDVIPISENIVYTKDIKPIIDNNCINCHSNPPQNGAPMSLLMYENVKEAVENRDLINRISTEDLSSVMPLGGPRLPQNLIDIIIQWNEDGLIEE